MAAGATGESTHRTEFRAFLDRDWQAWLAESPELGTLYGYPGHNGRWTDDSPEGIERRWKHLAQARAALDRFSVADLSPEDRIDHDLYRNLLDEAEGGRPFGEEALPFHFGMPHNLWMPMSQMEGVHLTVADILALQPRSTSRDVADLVARLDRSGEAIEQNLALLREGLARGYSPPRAAVSGVADQVKGLIATEPRASPLLQPFAERPSGVGEEEWARAVEQAVRAYETSARPALTHLHTYLQREYLPRCRPEVGASALPNGPAYYARLIRWQTTTALSAEEIHQIGLRELDRIHAEMEKIRTQVGFRGSLAEFYAYLRTDPRFFLTDPETLVEKYRALGKRADAGLARLFGRLPRLPYAVEAMPAYKAPSSPAAYYQGGSLEDGRPGTFYVNTHHLDSRPLWEMEDLLLHEAVPGHHLQLAISDELADLPSFRRHSGYTAFVEGWGLYAETLGEELGFYKDPLSKMGQLIADAWRSVRLVVDTGLHAKGWSRQQAIDFFAANAGRSLSDITVEIDRYIVWPGQALGYKIGQLRFSALRRRAEQALGDRFRLREFHDVLLGQGGLPLDMVERRVDEWIAAQRSGSSPAVPSG